MQTLFVQHGGDYDLVIQDYIRAEREGRVPRKSLVMSAETYADLLWRDGIGKGWLDASKTDWTLRHASPTGAVPERVSQGRALSVATITPKQAHTLPSFDVSLREMGEFWKFSELRPRPSDDALVHWSRLIQDWIDEPSMPLLIRKGTLRALRRKHSEGRTFVSCDNSPAHWAFMGAFLNERPTLNDVSAQLTGGQVPVAMARTREESKQIVEGSVEPLGGFLGQSRYGSVNRFPNGIAYKLCHLEGVGLRSRGEVEHFSLAILQAHMRRFLDPANMIVVPLEYAGVGECAAFLGPFIHEDQPHGV